MQLGKIYIISWFGDNEEIKQIRKTNHHKQLVWLQSLGLVPVVLAQDYSPEDYFPGVDYIRAGKLPTIADARNVLLHHFYNSDADFGMISDDDCFFYDGKEAYGDGSKIFDILKTLDMSHFEDIDLFVPICPVFTPFTQFYNDNKDLIQNNLVFEKNYIMKGIYFLKNLKKIYGQELFFDPKIGYVDGEFYGGEDYFFAYQMIAKGYGVYRCRNIVAKEIAKSTWAVKQEDRRQGGAVLDDCVKQAFNVDRKDFMKTYFLKPSKISIDKYNRLETNLESFLNG